MENRKKVRSRELGLWEPPRTASRLHFPQELKYKVRLQSTLEREYNKNGEAVAEISLQDYEKDILETFIQRVRHISNTRPGLRQFILHDRTEFPPDDETFWWLSLLCHYGGPTRFIDFTLDLRSALYFAIEQYFKECKKGNKSKTLYIYAFKCDEEKNKLPTSCNKKTKACPDMNAVLGCQIGTEACKKHDADHKLNTDNVDRYYGWDRPYYQNIRIEAQKGMFVYPFDPDYEIFGSDERKDLNTSWFESCYHDTEAENRGVNEHYRIEINAGAVQELKAYLEETCNLTEDTIYLDIGKIAESLKNPNGA